MSGRGTLRRRAWLRLPAAVALLLAACERGPAPATAPAGAAGGVAGMVPAPPTARAPTSSRPAAVGLHDRVANPAPVASEQGAARLRLLSAAPNVTEICWALGLGPQLVGRTRYCAYPPEVLSVPSIGDLYNLNVEVLLRLAPDLILVSGASRAIADRLTRLGLPFETVPDVALDDLFIAIERIGARTGRPETARALSAGVRADLAAVAARYAGAPRRRVLLLTAPLPEPPTQADAAGPGSFYDDLLRLAGHANVVPAGRPFAPVGLEHVVHADPDVIVELAADAGARPAGDADALRAWRQVGPLRAVAGGRVHVLVGPEHFLLGPRLPFTFEALCRIIAGDHE